MEYSRIPSKKDNYELYRHLKNGMSADEFFLRYVRLLSVEAKAHIILPYSQRTNPDLTLHDANHSIRVIDNANTIIDMIPKSLNETELVLVYMSCWYHDIGMLLCHDTYNPENKNKPNHAQVSAEMIRKHDWLVDGSNEFKEALCKIIISHNNTIDLPENVRIDGEDVRLKMIASILCLADLCDYNEYRAQKEVYELICDDIKSDESRKHWIANKSVIIEISRSHKMIFVRYDPSVDCSVIIDTFKRYAPMHIERIGLEVDIEYINTSEDDQYN